MVYLESSGISLYRRPVQLLVVENFFAVIYMAKTFQNSGLLHLAEINITIIVCLPQSASKLCSVAENCVDLRGKFDMIFFPIPILFCDLNLK